MDELNSIAQDCLEELENQLSELKQLSEDIASENTFYLINNGMLSYLENIHTLVKDISIAFSEMSKTKIPVDFMLSARKCNSEYSYLGKMVLSSLNNCISNLKNRKSIGKTAENPLLGNLCNNESVTDELLFPNDQLKKDMDNVWNMLRKVRETANKMIANDMAILGKVSLGNDVEKFNDALKIYVKDLAKGIYKEVYRDLKRQALSMKEKRTDKLTKEHWGMVLEVEDEILKLAVKKKLTISTDERLDYYETTEKQDMEFNLTLIKKMRNIFVEDELFDLSEIPNFNKNLDYSNIKLFAKIVLRGNIIRFNIYPELQPKFDAWMKGEEFVEAIVEKPAEREEKNATSKKNIEDKSKKNNIYVLRSSSAMAEWKKLQKMGWIDEDLQPMTNLQEAAVIASVMGDKLHITPKWSAFEELWNMKNLATKLSRAMSSTQAEKYIHFQMKVENTLGISHKMEY